MDLLTPSEKNPYPTTFTRLFRKVLAEEISKDGVDTHGLISTTSPSYLTRKAVIIGVSIGVSVLFFVVVLCVICVKMNKRRIKKMMEIHGSNGENYYSSRSTKTIFSYEELNEVTSRFSQANLLGQGGFSVVYKGCLPNGIAVAVKSLRSGSQQGKHEFNTEIDIISQVHHCNLVSLLGFCTAPGKILLVYKFVPNRTLEYHLHGINYAIETRALRNPGLNLDWPKRLRIAIGSAKGLAYLHNDCQPKIIHGDIKAGNILLDEDFEPKVSDFGLAKLKGDNATHVSTRAMGTPGYISSEYYEESQVLTEKTDVFSFGVMLVEIITGRQPTGAAKKDNSYVQWAKPLLKTAHDDGHYDGLVDARLGDNFDRIQMARMVACAQASIRESPAHRPEMKQVARVLEGIVPMNALTVRRIMEAEILRR